MEGKLDPRTRHYLLPKQIVWQTEGKARPSGASGLLEAGGIPCRLKHEGEAPGILLDFGREIHGGIQIANV